MRNIILQKYRIALCIALLLPALVLPLSISAAGITGNDSSFGQRTGEAIGNEAADLAESATDALDELLPDAMDEETSPTQDGSTETNAQDGFVGGEATEDPVETDTTPVESDTTPETTPADKTTESTENSTSRWIGIIIAILVIAALAAVLLALFPRTKERNR